MALSHNGNLTNAAQLRSQLAKEGAMFQTTVDSEVVLSLITRSRKATLPERVAEAANTIKGAFSILIMNDEQLIAFRDPMASGRCAWAAWTRAGWWLRKPVPWTW